MRSERVGRSFDRLNKVSGRPGDLSGEFLSDMSCAVATGVNDGKALRFHSRVGRPSASCRNTIGFD